MNIKLFLPFLGLLLLSACAKENASDVNQDKIYTDYEVFYDKNTDKTIVLAKFNFGGPTGTILELDSTATVKFNNDILGYNAVYGGHYREYAGRITSGTFTYTNLNNVSYVNQMPAGDTVAFQPSFTQLQKSAAQTITWLGPVLAANQSVGIFVGTYTWGQAALSWQDVDGATNVVLGISQMSSLTPATTATVFMDRQTETVISQGTAEGGKIRTKYRALNQTIQIIN
jgi:hypothetical protein